MTEVTRIADQLRRAVEGEAWHGPDIRSLLQGLSAEEAAQRPIPEAHSAWEIVHHVATWLEGAKRYLDGVALQPTPEDNWPVEFEVTDDAWAAELDRLMEAYRALHAAIQELDEISLNGRVIGQSYTVYILLHGVIQHTLYHAGQLALLERAREQAAS